MASSESTAIEQVSQIPAYQPGTDWETLIQSADEVLGYDLARDELADDLVGVPFVITGVVFRPGVMRDKKQQAYVSCETRISNKLDLRAINGRREGSRLPRLSDLDALTFSPNSHVVFNDGSTGVYRQMVQYLWTRKFITLKAPVSEAGSYGESSFDLPPGDWTGTPQGRAGVTESGFHTYSANLLLYCPRGLRLSLYENEYTQTGKTRYIG